ncbi:MAG: hypothetical protein MJ231_05825 [bacterium]|nr:hypothetical protein [bacterium]
MYEKKTNKLATFKLIFISICLLLTVTLITGLVPIPAFSFLGKCVGAQNAYAQEGEDDGSKGTGDGEGKEEPKAEENGSESADKTKDGAEGQSKEGDERQPKEEPDGQGDTDSDKEDGSEKDKDKKDKDSIFDVNQFTLLSDKEMTGSGQSNDPFVVYNAEQLVMVLSSFSSSYICLGNDIELETDIDGVERYATSFNGYLEGNGHTISQNAVEIYKDYSVGGGATSLFTGLDDGAVIKNLNLNMSVSSNEYVSGLLANELSGKVIISNCSFSGTVKNFSSNESIVGGVVGRVHSDAQALFENITSDVEVISLSGTVRIAGGIVGKSESADVVMNNCTMEESSTVSATGSMSVAFKYAIEVLKLIVGVLLGKASVE